MNDTRKRFLKFVEDNSDLALTTSVLDCQIAIRRLLNDLAAARAELARAYRERDASIKELAEQLADLDAARAGGTR